MEIPKQLKDDIWDFIDKDEFNEKSNKDNIIKYKNERVY